MRRRSPFALVLAVLLAACDPAIDDPEEEEEVVVTEEVSVEDEQITTTTLPPEDEDLEATEDDAGPLRVETLLPEPIVSGTFEKEHWIKWKLDAAIADPVDLHTTFQLNILSAEDDVFGAGFTFPLDGGPFASGFCLEDRPNCDDGTVSVEVEVGPERDVLIFRIPEGTFNNATGLTIDAFIQTFPTADANPDTENVTGGAGVPLGTDERDPC